MSYQPTVSIVIKALNEERRIEEAIRSSLQAIANIGGEVILADSCSTDCTIEIAKQFPIKIVQLANPEERCCGAGPQMGYQHATGEFIYILDGDMKMLPGFLEKAVELMRTNPAIVGVGGVVVEMNTSSLEYIARMERASDHMQPGEVDRLDMGGLYRKSAVDASGYFSDRNLHSYEEFDLAIRLRTAGGKLHRINMPAVQHHGHDAPPYKLLKRRWSTKYICGLGELVRASTGKPEFKLLLRGARELRIYSAVICWWIAIGVLGLNSPIHSNKVIAPALLFLLPFAAMTARKKSVEKAIFSVISWNFNAAGLVRGILNKRITPKVPLRTILLQDKIVQKISHD